MMMGIGHFRPRASMVKAVTGAAAGTTARSASVIGTELASALLPARLRGPPHRRRRACLAASGGGACLAASGDRACLAASGGGPSSLVPRSSIQATPLSTGGAAPLRLADVHHARVRSWYARRRAKMPQTCGVLEGSRAVRDTVCTTRCSRTEEGPRLDYR